jgi:hypothetical protein
MQTNLQPEEQIESEKKETFMFGNKELEDVYYKTKNTIVDLKILRLYQKEVLENGAIQITICNYHRLIRHPGNYSVTTMTRDIINDTWVETETPSVNMCLLPMNRKGQTRGEEIWRSILSHTIDLITKVHGLKLRGHPDGHIGNLKSALMYNYCGTYKKIKRKKGELAKPSQFKEGIVSQLQWRQASRALVKNIWNEIINKEVLGKIVSMKGFQEHVYLAEYIQYAKYGEYLIQHYKERPNLLPLLQFIPPEHWKRRDLFSKKLWVKGEGRKTTFIDRMNKGIGPRSLKSFDSPHHYNWIFSRSNRVILSVCKYNSFENAKFLADIKIQKDLPANLYNVLLKIVSDVGHRAAYCENYVKAYLKHCIEIWKKRGYKELTFFLKDYNGQHQILDWLYNEGLAQGLPKKNSTWESMKRRSDAWHINALKKQKTVNNTWESAISERENENYVVKAITASFDLIDEGFEQSHCVGSYDKGCLKGKYRIFRIQKLSDNRRYTLCIENKGTNWSVQQVMGYANSSAPEDIRQLSRNLATEYSRAERDLEKARRKMATQAA